MIEDKGYEMERMKDDGTCHWGWGVQEVFRGDIFMGRIIARD